MDTRTTYAEIRRLAEQASADLDASEARRARVRAAFRSPTWRMPSADTCRLAVAVVMVAVVGIVLFGIML